MHLSPAFSNTKSILKLKKYYKNEKHGVFDGGGRCTCRGFPISIYKDGGPLLAIGELKNNLKREVEIAIAVRDYVPGDNTLALSVLILLFGK